MASTSSRLPTFTAAAAFLSRAAARAGRLLWRPPYRHIFGWAAAVLIVAWLAYDWYGGRQWAAYRQAAAARGLVLDRPRALPPIPDAENFAAATGPFTQGDLLDFRGISLNFPDLTSGRRMTIEKAYTGYQPVVRIRRVNQMGSVPSADTKIPRTAEDFLSFCDEHFKSEWPAVLEAETRAKTQFAMPSYPESEPHPLSYLMLRKTAQLHCMRGMAFLDLDRSEEALAEVRGSLRLSQAMGAGGEPGLVHGMVETAITALPLGIIWEGLVDRRWSDADLVALQKELASVHPEEKWPNIVNGERQWENTVCDELASASLLRAAAAHPKVWFSVWPAGWVRESQLAANQAADAALLYIDKDGRWQPEQLASFNFDRINNYRHWLATIMVPSCQRAAKRVVVVEAWVHEAAVAVALERYRLRNHDLPEHLDALVPEFLSAIPVDPIDGERVRYTRESAESYRVWCTAEYAGGDFSDVVSAAKQDGHRVILWSGLAPEAKPPTTAAR